MALSVFSDHHDGYVSIATGGWVGNILRFSDAADALSRAEPFAGERTAVFGVVNRHATHC